MLTWLDWEVARQAGDFLRSPLSKGLAQRSVPAAFRVLTALAWDLLLDKVEAARDDAIYWAERLVETQAILHFLVPDELDPRGIQLSPSLAAQFLGGRCPDTGEVLDIIRQSGHLYLDVPPGAASFQDLDLRAVLVRDDRRLLIPRRSGQTIIWEPRYYDNGSGVWGNTPGEPIQCIAIFVAPGSNKALARIHWRWNMPDTGDSFNWGTSRQDQASATTEIENLISLSVLFHNLSDSSRRLPLPRISEDRLERLSLKKQQTRHKSFTLFRIIHMEAPPDRFGRPEFDIPRGGWKLGDRLRVRGHFRLQPHGPGAKLRRLQWIAAYEKGPADGERKHDLYRLEASERTGVTA